eukprot:6194712-Pleurochrysis_carterae.AAC.1
MHATAAAHIAFASLESALPCIAARRTAPTSARRERNSADASSNADSRGRRASTTAAARRFSSSAI